MTLATSELDALVRRDHPNPHAVLGPHAAPEGVVIRTLRPAACEIKAELPDGTVVELQQIHAGGVFEGVAEGAELPLRYRLDVDYGSAGSFTIDDPYAFGPTIGELDLHLMGEGRHEEIYEKLGAHFREHEGIAGTAFAVWAPSARAVSVVGDFNSWDGHLHPMRSMGATGIWELFIPDAGPGARYKYEILTQDNELLLKADPYAQQAENPPKTASVVSQPQHHWSTADRDWLAARERQEPLSRPISIYEVHLGSWRLNTLEDNRPLSYLELADELSAYVARHGLHPHRAAAGDAPPVQRLMGVSGHRLLRAGAELRFTRRSARVRGPPARERNRRDPRLGPGALSPGPVRAGAVRRDRAVRACRPAPRRASRTGARSCSTSGVTRSGTS